MRKLVAIAIISVSFWFGLRKVAHGQELPSSPAKQSAITKTDYAVLGSILGMRTLDAYSTHYMLRHGNHEEIMPRALAASNAGMYAFGAATTAGQAVLTYELRKHHRGKLATTIELVHLGSLAYYPVHNLYLPDHK